MSSSNGTALHNPPPHSLEFERVALASMMVGEAEELTALLSPSDFFHGDNQRLFLAAMKLVNAGEPVNVLSLTDEAERQGLPLRSYVNELASQGFYRGEDAAWYADRLQKLGARRELQKAGQNLALMAEEHEDPSVTADLAQTLIDQAMTRRETLKEATASDWVSRAYLAASDGTQQPALATGFSELDRRVKLRRKQMWLLAGRPSMGKTALGLALWLGAARKGTPTVLYSLEMTEAECSARVISAETGIPSEAILEGTANEWQLEKLGKALAKLYELPALIVDEADTTVAAIKAHVRKMIRTHKIGLVIIDQAQTIAVRESHENENIRHTRMAYALKNLAKSLDVCVIVQNQLSRLNERRDAKSRRPMLSDIRDSGSWEQAADGVLMVHREEYYRTQQGTTAEPRHQCLEVLVRKQRNGWKGPVMMQYDLFTQRIGDRTERYEGHEPEAEQGEKADVDWDSIMAQVEEE